MRLKSFIIQLGFVSAIVPELSPVSFLESYFAS